MSDMLQLVVVAANTQPPRNASTNVRYASACRHVAKDSTSQKCVNKCPICFSFRHVAKDPTYQKCVNKCPLCFSFRHVAEDPTKYLHFRLVVELVVSYV